MTTFAVSWFCADNYTYETITDNHRRGLADQCLAELVCVCIHGLLIVVMSTTLCILGCCTVLRYLTSPTIVLYPGHNVKWILSIVIWLVLLCCLGEGVLTDLTRNPVTQPHLYIPPTVALTSMIITLTYYHHMEYWDVPRMSWLLVIYWAFSLVGEAMKLSNLYSQFGLDITILRLLNTLLLALLYASCLLIELNVIRTMVFGWCYSRPRYPSELNNPDMLLSHKYTNFASRSLFYSLKWLLKLGYQKPLEMSDLGCLPQEFHCKYQYHVFEKAYEAEKKKVQSNNKKPSLWKTYLRACGDSLLRCTILKFIADLLNFIPPLAIGGIVAYATRVYYEEDTPNGRQTVFITVGEFFSNGYVLVVVVFVSVFFKGLSVQAAAHATVIPAFKIRMNLQSFTYEKLLRLSSWSLSGGDMAAGQITNHISADAMTIQWFFMIQLFFVSIPFRVIFALLLLYLELGISAFYGSLLFFIVSPIQYKIITKMSEIQFCVLSFADERLKKSTELLQSMKLLKLYGWEELFTSVIEKIRTSEVRQIVKSGICLIISSFLSQSTPVITTFITFAIYSTIESSPLTPELAFSALALFNHLATPMLELPFAISETVNAIISTRRFQVLFEACEVSEYVHGRPSLSKGYTDVTDIIENGGNKLSEKKQLSVAYKGRLSEHERDDLVHLIHDTPPHYGTFESKSTDTPVTDIPDHLAIQINDGSFAWDTDEEAVLTNININIPTGSLTMIIGLVGSGKSSLLSAMLGEMSLVTGTVQFNRSKCSISYVSQRPWVRNATLRENILFGEPFDYKRYQQILDVCSLQPDIDILLAGDNTEIGEKGINLSGGQKQRISVARALYSRTDIVILDDPLASLDVHVGAHLMENGIVEFLMEEERTVIVVTHHLQYLCHADQVVIMEDCTVARQGDLKEIRRHSPELYSDWQKSITVITESEASQSEGEDVNTERKHLLDVVKQMSNQSVDGIQEDGLLIVKEERETGSVSLHMYLSYARAIKYPFVFLICILYITQTALHIVNNFWLSEWSEAGVNIDNKTEAQLEEELDYYLNGYAALSFGFAGFNLLTVAIIIICSLFAIRRMYIRLLRNIVHAPMRFFDTTPLGRILNRFSTDTQVIDQRLWKTTVQIIQASLPCISAIVVSAVVTPIFIGAVAPVIILYYFVQSYFLSSARELQRLDSITRSPIFEHFSETVGGLSTVRAFRHEAKFRQSFMHRMNKNNLAQLYLNYSHRWLGVNLEILGALVILISGLSSLISCELGQIEPSLVGLALTYSVSISGFLTWLVRAGADCEMYMNAVERVEYYSQVNTEQYQGVYNPPPDWPDKGDVILENVSVRYATGLDPVLRDVNVRFKAGEKVGICGRTGSGKSSLTLALYRIIDTFQGRILIDGVDISHVPLLTLRSRLTIIPQDPVLFQGTIRFNLDPEGSKTDDELWQALEIAQLKPVVSELHMTLDAQVTEEGENFSLGQRQLFCLARAFLRKARILVMDEATASIDIKTDKILQQVVANAFADMTVLTIAHRIATILDADSVLVLSDGSVEEYDTPSNLLANSDSAFVSLVNGPS